MNIYVGNLSYDTSEQDLRDAFGAHGVVSSAQIIRDKFSNQSKGFGFVEMPNQAEAQAAIRNMGNAELQGRPIKVNEARPRPEGGSRGGHDRRGGGGGDRRW